MCFVLPFLVAVDVSAYIIASGRPLTVSGNRKGVRPRRHHPAQSNVSAKAMASQLESIYSLLLGIRSRSRELERMRLTVWPIGSAGKVSSCCTSDLGIGGGAAAAAGAALAGAFGVTASGGGLAA